MSHLPEPALLWCLSISLELEALDQSLHAPAHTPRMAPHCPGQSPTWSGTPWGRPEAALQPRPWVPQGMGLTQPLAAPARPPLSFTASLPAAPFPPPSFLARASSFLRPQLQLPAECPCLLWTTLGFSSATPTGGGLGLGAHSLRLGWVSLRLDLGPEGPLLVPAPHMPSNPGHNDRKWVLV